MFIRCIDFEWRLRERDEKNNNLKVLINVMFSLWIYWVCSWDLKNLCRGVYKNFILIIWLICIRIFYFLNFDVICGNIIDYYILFVKILRLLIYKILNLC